jgi:hypothetical protein
MLVSVCFPILWLTHRDCRIFIVRAWCNAYTHWTSVYRLIRRTWESPAPSIVGVSYELENHCLWRGSNPDPFALELDALPLRHWFSLSNKTANQSTVVLHLPTESTFEAILNLILQTLQAYCCVTKQLTNPLSCYIYLLRVFRPIYCCVTKQLTNPLSCYIYLLRVLHLLTESTSTNLLLRNKTANQSTAMLHLLTESTSTNLQLRNKTANQPIHCHVTSTYWE